MEVIIFLAGSVVGSVITLLTRRYWSKDKLHICSFSKGSEQEVILTVGVAPDNLRSLKKLKGLLPGNGWVSASKFVGRLKPQQFFVLRVKDDFQTDSEWVAVR